MKSYSVKIKDGKRATTIHAKTELEAKVKYCAKKGLNYSLLASKLEVKEKPKA